MSQPFVSCIMPTTARRKQFLPLALELFHRQDYPNKELVVVDDALNEIPADLPVVKNIKYARSEQSRSVIGVKRNEACKIAKGDIIIHLDDDDWYAPDWIIKQVELLQQTGADICGLSELLFFAPGQSKAWLYKNNTPVHKWVAGATMCYRRALWEKYPFKHMQVGEDNDFVWHSGGKVAYQTYLKGFVATVHSGNTSPKRTSVWAPHPIEDIQAIMGDHYNRYSELGIK